MKDGIRYRFAWSIGHQTAIRPTRDGSSIRCEAGQYRIEQSCAPSVGQKLATEADQTAGRDFELKPHPARTVVDHFAHAPAAGAHVFRHDTDIGLWNVDHR